MKKIVLYLELYMAGGVDTFVINLINSWPNEKDDFLIVCNKSHPGLKRIKQGLKGSVEFFEYDYFTIPIVYKFLKIKFLCKLISFTLYIPIFLYYLYKNYHIFIKTKCDECIVVNGGYPGGKTCLAASLSWYFVKGKKSIHNFHNYATAPSVIFRLWDELLDLLVRHATLEFITVSKGAAKSLVARKKLKSVVPRVIYNGVDLIDSSIIDEKLEDIVEVSKGDKICLMLATYEKRKGHKYLFEAFDSVLSEFNAVSLIICGYYNQSDYDYVDSLRARFSSLEGKVHLLSFRDDATNLINQADIIVVPSQEFESFGLVSIEAMALGKPVVATNVGGIPEVIGCDGGFCVDHTDFQQFSQKMLLLLKDEAMYQKMSENGLKRYKSKFSSSMMSLKYFEYLNDND